MVKRADLPVIDVLRVIDEYCAERRGQDTWKLFDDLMSGRVKPSPDIPARFPQFPYKIVLARLLQMDRQRLIDYGVVITRPWLTDKGRALLSQEEAPLTR